MRDDFTKEVIDVLARRVNLRCSMPSCRKGTAGPRTEPERAVNIGVAAHITAASAQGPRFDPSLTSDQRRAAENGIWLCQNHAKLVDNDASRYTVDELREWKRDAEAAALAELEGVPRSATMNDAALEMTFKKTSHTPVMYPTRHDYLLTLVVRNLGHERMTGYHVDLEMPARVLVDPKKDPRYEIHRSNPMRAFFRAVGKELFPGDGAPALAIPYFVDDQLFYNIHNAPHVFKELVTATLYRPGLPPISVERPFEELQIF